MIGRIESNIDFEELPQKINLSGTTFENRQNIIAGLSGSESINLIRKYGNEHDKNAIAVELYGEIILGWIPRQYSKIIAPEIDNGVLWRAKIDSLLGNEDCLRGVLIQIFIDGDASYE